MDSLCVAALLLALYSPASAFAPTVFSRGNPRSIDHAQSHVQLSASSATRHRCDGATFVMYQYVVYNYCCNDRAKKRAPQLHHGMRTPLALAGHARSSRSFRCFVSRSCCSRESSADAERRRGVGGRGRELVLEATAMDRMDRADFVRLAAGAASTLLATSLAKESLAADVSGAYVAMTAALKTSQQSTTIRASNPCNYMS